VQTKDKDNIRKETKNRVETNKIEMRKIIEKDKTRSQWFEKINKLTNL
jgi:hypothetical protein